MTLQLALDGAEKGRTLDEAMGLARAARQYTDIIEVGTSFVLRDGLAAVKKFARAGFGVPILADVKIMDCGAGLCAMACEAGADIVTVMAFAADKTIEGVVREAHTRGRRVMADLLGHAKCRCGRPARARAGGGHRLPACGGGRPAGERRPRRCAGGRRECSLRRHAACPWQGAYGKTPPARFARRAPNG